MISIRVLTTIFLLAAAPVGAVPRQNPQTRPSTKDHKDDRPTVVQLGTVLLDASADPDAGTRLAEDAAARLLRDPKARLVLDAYSAPDERTGVAAKRAEGLAEYFVNAHRIDPKRVVVRVFDELCPQPGTTGKRIEVFLLASYHTPADVEAVCGDRPDCIRQCRSQAPPRSGPLAPARDGAEPVIQMGHGDSVRAVAFYPDGLTALTGSEDGMAKLWDVPRDAEVQTLAGHTGAVTRVAASPTGCLVATGGADGTASLWDATTGEEYLRLSLRDGGGVTALAFSPDGRFVAAGNEMGQTQIWDTATGSEARRLDRQEASVNAVAFSPDGKRIATACDDRTARIWEMANGNEIQRLEGHSRPVVSIAFSPDGQSVLTASEDYTVRVWDADEGDELRRISTGLLQVFRAALSSDGRFVLVGGYGAAQLWEVATGKALTRFDAPRTIVHDVAFSPDGRSALLGLGDGTARIVDTASGSVSRRLRGDVDRILSASLSKDGRTLLVGLRSGAAPVWNLSTGQEVRKFRHGRYAYATLLSPDGRFAYIEAKGKDRKDEQDGRPSGTHLWNVEDGAPLLPPDPVRAEDGRIVEYPGHKLPTGVRPQISGRSREEYETYTFGLQDAWTRKIHGRFTGTDMDLSVDERFVVTGQTDGTVRLQSAANGGEIRVFVGLYSSILGVLFSPDAKTILAQDVNGNYCLWKTRTGEQIWRMSSPVDADESIEFSAQFSVDGQTIVLGVDRLLPNRHVQLLDAATGELLWDLARPRPGVVDSLSPKQRYALRRTEENDVQIIDASTEKELWRVERPNFCVFSQDGRFVLAVGQDGILRVRTIKTGRERARVVCLRGRVWAVFDPRGERYDASKDGRVNRGFVFARDTLPLAVEHARARYYKAGLLSELLARKEKPKKK